MATKAEQEAAAKAEAEAKLKAEQEAAPKAEAEAAKVFHLKNNTKGLRHVAGVKVLPGKSVELDADQLQSVKANAIAMAWINSGELSLS